MSAVPLPTETTMFNVYTVTLRVLVLHCVARALNDMNDTS